MLPTAATKVRESPAGDLDLALLAAGGGRGPCRSRRAGGRPARRRHGRTPEGGCALPSTRRIEAPSPPVARPPRRLGAAGTRITRRRVGGRTRYRTRPPRALRAARAWPRQSPAAGSGSAPHGASAGRAGPHARPRRSRCGRPSLGTIGPTTELDAGYVEAEAPARIARRRRRRSKNPARATWSSWAEASTRGTLDLAQLLLDAPLLGRDRLVLGKRGLLLGTLLMKSRLDALTGLALGIDLLG